MSTPAPPTHTDDQLEILERFDQALDSALAAGVHISCLHHALDNRATRLRVSKRPALQPIGWRTIAGVTASPHHHVTPGTPEAHAEIFDVPDQFDRNHAAQRLREFKRRATAAIGAGWSRVDLHRSVDAGYWSTLGEMFERAGQHAWRAKIAAPRPRAA